MKNIYNALSDLQECYPYLEFKPKYKDSMYIVEVVTNCQPIKYMKLEVILNYEEESVVASVLSTYNFEYSEFAPILDKFFEKIH